MTSKGRSLPARVRAVLERWRSNAAGKHNKKKSRGEEKRRAINEERKV